MPSYLDQLLQSATQWPKATNDPDASGMPWQVLIDGLLEDSLELCSSQIHIESMRYTSVIRYRISGKMVKRAEIEHGVHSCLVMSLKRFLKMDIFERRRPQFSSIKEVALNGGRHYVEATSIRAHEQPGFVLCWRAPRAVRRLDSMGLESSQLRNVEKLLTCDSGWLSNLRSQSVGVAILVAMSDAGRRPVRIATADSDFPALADMGIEQRIHQRSLDGKYSTWATLQLADDCGCFVMDVGSDLVPEVIAAVREGKLICTGFGRSVPNTTDYLQFDGVNRRELAESVVGSIEQFMVIANCSLCEEKYRPNRWELEALRIRCARPERLVFSKSKGCPACRTYPPKRTGVHEVFLADDVRQLIEDDQPPTVIRRVLLANGAIDFYTALVRKVVKRVIPSWVAIMHQRYLFQTPQDHHRWVDVEVDD